MTIAIVVEHRGVTSLLFSFLAPVNFITKNMVSVILVSVSDYTSGSDFGHENTFAVRFCTTFVCLYNHITTHAKRTNLFAVKVGL